MHCVENTPTTRVLYLKDKCLGKPNISQIILRVWFLTLVLHCHLFLHPYLLQKYYPNLNYYFKYLIFVWNQVFWYEHDLSILCRSFHRSKAQKDFWKIGFCSLSFKSIDYFQSKSVIIIIFFICSKKYNCLLPSSSTVQEVSLQKSMDWDHRSLGASSSLMLQWYYLLHMFPHNSSIWKPAFTHHEILMLVLSTVGIIHLSALLGTLNLSQWLGP